MNFQVERKPESGLNTGFSKSASALRKAKIVAEPQLSSERVYLGLLETVTTTFYEMHPMIPMHVNAECENGRPRVYDYGFIRGRRQHPLIFLIPGFGCPYNDRVVSCLAGILAQRGYHVAVLHSPSHPDFLMSSHKSGIGGVTSDDGRDALLGIEAILKQLRHLGVDFNKTHLVGYSMGALNAAFARFHDAREMDRFERVVLINPPVDLAHGTLQLDSFVNALAMPKLAFAALASKAAMNIVAPKKLKRDSALLIKKFLDRPHWSERDLRALLGYSFSNTVSGGIKAASLLGVLDKNHGVRTFSDYCEAATVPYYRGMYPHATSVEFFKNESLLKIGPELARDRNVYVLHNENDFLVRPRDVKWLKAHFSGNVQIFDRGGHLGNLWRPEFQSSLESALGI
jgi:pimeloyl-ACP methyl ester carboxylesterase